ncbi:MAG: hypothetical protein QXG86_01255 [Candidatus Woesearchaeota archaeon]
MEKQEKQINLNINDGEAFFANEISVNFNPLNIFLDYKSITPRIDPRNREGGTFNMKHNVIILDPYTFKQTVSLMNETLKRYEKEFGRIEKPKPLEKIEKEQKIELKSKKGGSVPAYLG